MLEKQGTKHSIQINPPEDNIETELLKTKWMFQHNCQPAFFLLMKINVDTNKGGSKMPVTRECNGENIRKQGPHPSQTSGITCWSFGKTTTQEAYIIFASGTELEFWINRNWIHNRKQSIFTAGWRKVQSHSRLGVFSTLYRVVIHPCPPVSWSAGLQFPQHRCLITSTAGKHLIGTQWEVVGNQHSNRADMFMYT